MTHVETIAQAAADVHRVSANLSESSDERSLRQLRMVSQQVEREAAILTAKVNERLYNINPLNALDDFKKDIDR